MEFFAFNSNGGTSGVPVEVPVYVVLELDMDPKALFLVR